MPQSDTHEDRRARQVCAILDPPTFDLVDGMAVSLGRSRADVARDLLGQGLTALQAASAAQDRGEDGDSAAIAAVTSRAQQAQADDRVMHGWLDAVHGFLDGVAQDDLRRAADLATRSANALRAWSAEVQTAADDADLAAQRDLSEQLVTKGD